MAIMHLPKDANITVHFKNLKPDMINIGELESLYGERASLVLSAEGAPIAVCHYDSFQMQLLFERMPLGSRFRASVRTYEHWDKLAGAVLSGLKAALHAGGQPYASTFNYNVYLSGTAEEINGVLQQIFPSGPFYERLRPTFRSITFDVSSREHSQRFSFGFHYMSATQLRVRLNAHYDEALPDSEEQIRKLFDDGYDRLINMLQPLFERG